MSSDKAKMRELTQQFFEAVNFTKRTRLKRPGAKRSLFESPWFILLGPEGSGKTSLLQHANLHFNLAPKASDKRPTQHEPHWWVNQDVIMLDTPGILSTTPQLKYWQHFIKLVRKFSYRRDIRAIVITASIKDILNLDAHKTLAETIARQCNSLSKISRQTPAVYLAITQCDLVPGFYDYFSSFSKDERQQPWGFQLEHQDTVEMKVQINLEFNELLRRLNQQLIWRLHHEPDHFKRLKIKDFPVQMAQIKDGLLSFTETLARVLRRKAFVRGLYFVSAEQPQTSLSPKRSQRKEISTFAQPKSKPFFIHDLLKDIVFETPLIKKNNLVAFFSKMLLGIVALLGVGGIITAIAISFTQNNNRLEKVDQAITKYRLLASTSSNSLQNELAMLKALDTSRNLLSRRSRFFHKLSPGATDNKKLRDAIKNVYKQSAKQKIIPIIQKSLEQCISSHSQLHPSMLYRCLTSYLMLTEPSQFDSALFKQNLLTLWHEQYQFKEKNFDDALTSIIGYIAKQKQPVISPNYSLITQAQEKLKNLGATQLGLAILLSRLHNHQLFALNLNSDKNAAAVMTLKDPNISIPQTYTIASYQQLSKQDLQDAAAIILHGNWVIGETHYNLKQPTTLQNKILAQYFNNYYADWNQFINNIQLKPFQSLAQIKQAINILSNDASPLLQLLELLKTNNVYAYASTNMNSSLTTINAFLRQPSSYSINDLVSTLRALNQYLATVITSADALSLTKKRMINHGVNDPLSKLMDMSRHLPSPLNQWMHQLALNTWQQLIDTSKEALSQTWQQDIALVYQNQISNRYPFNPQANDDVSLISFANFFAPTGLIQTFFNDNLRPFIDTEQTTWKNKSLDGASFNITPFTLTFFQRSFHLDNLFFPNHDKQLYLPVTLQATNFSADLSNVIITYGQHTLVLSKNNTPAAIQWPIQNTDPAIAIRFNATENTADSLHFQGPWSLWRMMNAANLKPDATPQHWIGMIKHNKMAFQFLLGTKQNNNPFRLGVFRHLQFPTTLFSETDNASKAQSAPPQSLPEPLF
jgi:type VI secretion system protein ImpL